MNKYIQENKDLLLKQYSVGNIPISVLAKRHSINPRTLNDFFHRMGVEIIQFKTKNYKVYSINEDFFKNIDSEEKAYVLGFIYADGCIYKNSFRIHLSCQDVDILEKISIAMGSNIPIKYYNYQYDGSLENTQPQVLLVVNRKNLTKHLLDKGLHPAKTFSIDFPSFDIVPRHLMRHFIRGYFDGDGSVSSMSAKTVDGFPKWCFSLSVNNAFGEKLSLYLATYENMTVSFYSQGNRNISSCSSSGSRITERFLDYLYKDSHIYLDRKYNKYLELKAQRTYQRSLGSIK